MFSRELDASLLEAQSPELFQKAQVLPSHGNGQSPRADVVQQRPDQTVLDFQDITFDTGADSRSLL